MISKYQITIIDEMWLDVGRVVTGRMRIGCWQVRKVSLVTGYFTGLASMLVSL